MTQADLILTTAEERHKGAKADQRDAITRNEVLELLDYDRDTGVFTWKVTIAKGKKGARAGTVCSTSGHRHLMIHGVRCKAHRVAWLVVVGEWPSGEIDHINGVKDDNRFCNLRDVDRITNQQNERRARRSNKSTGLLGAYPLPNGRFCAKLSINSKPTHLGCFDSAEEAHAAYVEAKRTYHEGCTL